MIIDGDLGHPKTTRQMEKRHVRRHRNMTKTQDYHQADRDHQIHDPSQSSSMTEDSRKYLYDDVKY